MDTPPERQTRTLIREKVCEFIKRVYENNYNSNKKNFLFYSSFIINTHYKTII